jgi:hypothetical protein
MASTDLSVPHRRSSRNVLLTLALALTALVLPTALAAPADAVQSLAPLTAAPSAAKAPKTVTRVVRGTKATGKYFPESVKYNLKVPTLGGVTATVKKAFDTKIDSIIAAEVDYYSAVAFTKSEYDATKKAEGGEGQSAAKWLAYCTETFHDLSGKFTASVYKKRYVSVIITFDGRNAACTGLGGLWSGPPYQSDRSVTIDTKTGTFKSLSDFTSNSAGKVTAAVKTWYAGQSHEYLTKRPGVGKGLKVCDRPGNVNTTAPAQYQDTCYRTPSLKTGTVAWLVQKKGIRLTFPAGEGLRYATLPWSQIPQRL